MTPMMIGAVNPNLRVMTGPLRPRMNRPRSPYPPYMMRGRLSPFIGPRTSPPMTPSQIRMSPPLRPMPMHLYRNPSPTAGLIRITPRHLPPQYRMHQPNLNNPNFYPRFQHQRMSPSISPRSPLRVLRCAGRFSPLRPPHFHPRYYMNGPRSPRPILPAQSMNRMPPPMIRPGVPPFSNQPPSASKQVPHAAQSAQTKPVKFAPLQPVKADIR